MRTVEVFIVIVILLGAFVVASQFAVLPSPRLISSPGLRELALTTLQSLDSRGDLTKTVFSNPSDPSWEELQIALSASLPPNVVYNFTVYDIEETDGTITYNLVYSISDSGEGLGVGSESASYLVTSPNVTYTVTPHKVGEEWDKKLTLYILNCEDANGWWITGYTAQSLASDFQDLLSPYFETTILINTTYQLGLLLNGTSLIGDGEDIYDAVVINTFGEVVPIPAGYYTTVGYDSEQGSYAKYTYILGQRVNQYNWTWVSVVGYPLYYVTNTATFVNSQNTFGIYGMVYLGPAGLNAFLQGLDGKEYTYDSGWITGSPGVVEFSSDSYYFSNYYGIYPAPYQTATRALPSSILVDYNLRIPAGGEIFERIGDWISGATYCHIGSDGQVHGTLTAIGLTRTPDIRVTALGLLTYYRPTLYRSEFGASGTSRLVILQLGQQGGA
jgi:hypothetical protein